MNLDKYKLIEEMKMKNWSICNISEGMESEVRLSPDDIIDSFLNENGIYAGSPLLEFIDIKKLRRSLLNEMDADIPQHIMNPPSQTRTAEAKFKGMNTNVQLDKNGQASFTFQVDVPAFTSEKEKDAVMTKVRIEIGKAQRVACNKVCQLYFTTPDIAYSNVMRQFNLGITNENDDYVSVDKDEKGTFDLSGIQSGKMITCKLLFTPTIPAFQDRFLQIRVRNHQLNQGHRNIDAAEAAAVQAAKPQAPAPAPAEPQGPSGVPTGPTGY